jgi:hypothetical protein
MRSTLRLRIGRDDSTERMYTSQEEQCIEGTITKLIRLIVNVERGRDRTDEGSHVVASSTKRLNLGENGRHWASLYRVSMTHVSVQEMPHAS